MPYGDDDDWLLSLPLFHVSGQGILWRWLQAGARLTVREKQPLEQALQGCTQGRRELGITRKNSRPALGQRQPCQQGLRVIMGEQQHAVIRLYALLMKPCGQIVDAGAELLPAQHLVVETQSRFISTLLAPVPPRPVAKTF